jgi:hypothetical protein
MLSMSTPKNTHIYRLWHPTIKTHQLEKLTCLMFLWRGATSACERVLSIFARRFSLMQNLSNSPLCLVRTMPAFLRPGNFIVLLAQQCRLPVFVWDSYHSRPSYDGFFIRCPSASWHSSTNALHLFLSVCFCLSEHLERQSIDTKSTLQQHSNLGECCLHLQLLKTIRV